VSVKEKSEDSKEEIGVSLGSDGILSGKNRSASNAESIDLEYM